MRFLLILVITNFAFAEFVQTNQSVFHSYQNGNTLSVIRTQEPEGLFVLYSANKTPQEVDPTQISVPADRSLFLRIERGKLRSTIVAQSEYSGQAGLISLQLEAQALVTVTPSGFTVISHGNSALGFLGSNFVSSFEKDKVNLALPSGFSPYIVEPRKLTLNGADVPISYLGVQWQSPNNYCFQSQITIKDESGSVVPLSNFLLLVEPFVFNPSNSKIYTVKPQNEHEYETSLECRLRPI